MKIGISLKIDVTKLDKSRFFTGGKGTYCDLQTFIDIDSRDKYDNNGFITQSPTKEEREAKEQLPIVGNVRVFYNDTAEAARSAPKKAQPAPPVDDFEDDIPFDHPYRQLWRMV